MHILFPCLKNLAGEKEDEHEISGAGKLPDSIFA